MDSTTLAQNFNQVSEQLQARGQRVVVRRVRGFLEAGDSRGAEMFLLRAREALGSNDAGVSGLATSLRGFAAAGGDFARLLTEPAWVEGTAKEKHLSRLVDAAVDQQGLAGLVDQLASHQRALAAGEPLPPPVRQPVPGVMPPLPRITPAAAADTRAPLGSIFKPIRARAAVEAEVELESRALDLEEAGQEDFESAVPAEPAQISRLASPAEPIESPESIESAQSDESVKPGDSMEFGDSLEFSEPYEPAESAASTPPAASPPHPTMVSAPTSSAPPGEVHAEAHHHGPLHRPPTMLRPGRVLDMRIEAPPKQTSRLFLLLLVIGGLAAAKGWRDWYTERPVGGLRGQTGPHCAEGPGHFSFGPEESQQRFERGDATGKCNPDPVANPMGCDRPALLNGVRTLALGTPGGLDLVLALPTGTESVIEPGTYEVRGASDDQPTAMSNRPRCGAWTGTITVDSLAWQLRPRATSHARWEPADVSVRWDVMCTTGAPQRFQGCFSFGGPSDR